MVLGTAGAAEEIGGRSLRKPVTPLDRPPFCGSAIELELAVVKAVDIDLIQGSSLE